MQQHPTPEVPAGGAQKIWERGFQYIFYFQQNAAETVGLAPLEMLGHARDKQIKAAEFPKSAGIVNAGPPLPST